jgi:hypothetical protein
MKRNLAVGICALLTVGLVLYLAPPAKSNRAAPAPTPAPTSRVVATPDGKLMPVPENYGSVVIVSGAKLTNDGSASSAVPAAK